MRQLITGSSPLARGLNEQAIEEATTEVGEDHRGDTWQLCSTLHRNERHPHFVHDESEHDRYLEGIEYEESPRQSWLNHRTSSIHEGPMAVGLDGVMTPHSHGGGEPHFYHSSHYVQEQQE